MLDADRAIEQFGKRLASIIARGGGAKKYGGAARVWGWNPHPGTAGGIGFWTII